MDGQNFTKGVSEFASHTAELLQFIGDRTRFSRHDQTEGEGFEPSNGASPSPVFKTGAFNRSATLPSQTPILAPSWPSDQSSSSDPPIPRVL
jgi:hypothetical protein